MPGGRARSWTWGGLRDTSRRRRGRRNRWVSFSASVAVGRKEKRLIRRKQTEIISRFHNYEEDDGHAVKLGRGAAVYQQFSKQYADKDWMVLKGDEVWDKMFHLIVDSVESPG